MDTLPLEKQFTHAMFCENIKSIELETLKILLVDLHFQYLREQALFSEITKQGALKSF